MNKEMAEYILANKGYNFALSDVEDACEFLDHPELTPEDTANYHKWAEPYPRRCYCSTIGYTKKGKFYACHLDDNWIKMLSDMHPDKVFWDRFGEPYEGPEL